MYITNAELTSVCIALAAEIHCHLTSQNSKRGQLGRQKIMLEKLYNAEGCNSTECRKMIFSTEKVIPVVHSSGQVQ